MSGTDLNSTTDDLLLKYDDNFNENYNKIVSINSSIMNKEELIVKENDIIMMKNIYISSLQYGMIFVVIFGILFILYGIKYITLSKFIILLTILIIVFIVIVYYNIYVKNLIYNFENTLGNIGVQMKDYALSELANVSVQPYQCPNTCTTINNTPPNPNQLQTGSTPTLKIDPQNNVWKYGDMPMGGYLENTPTQQFYNVPTGIPDYPNSENEPQPFYDSTYPYTVYYQCQWLGPNNKNAGMPNNETNKYTTIPCSYRPNFQETARYICQQDPNNVDINSTIQNMPNCTDISIMS